MSDNQPKFQIKIPTAEASSNDVDGGLSNNVGEKSGQSANDRSKTTPVRLNFPKKPIPTADAATTEPVAEGLPTLAKPSKSSPKKEVKESLGQTLPAVSAAPAARQATSKGAGKPVDDFQAAVDEVLDDDEEGTPQRATDFPLLDYDRPKDVQLARQLRGEQKSFYWKRKKGRRAPFPELRPVLYLPKASKDESDAFYLDYGVAVARKKTDGGRFLRDAYERKYRAEKRRALARTKGWSSRKGKQANEQDLDILRFVVRNPFLTTDHALLAFKGREWTNPQSGIANKSGLNSVGAMEGRLRILKACGLVEISKATTPKVWLATAAGVRASGVVTKAQSFNAVTAAKVETVQFPNFVSAVLHSGAFDVLNLQKTVAVGGKGFATPRHRVDSLPNIINVKELESTRGRLIAGASGRVLDPNSDSYRKRLPLVQHMTVPPLAQPLAIGQGWDEAMEAYFGLSISNGRTPIERKEIGGAIYARYRDLSDAEAVAWFLLEQGGHLADDFEEQGVKQAELLAGNAWLFTNPTPDGVSYPDLVLPQAPKWVTVGGKPLRRGMSVGIEVERNKRSAARLRPHMDAYAANPQVFGLMVWVVSNRSTLTNLLNVIGGHDLDENTPAATDLSGVYQSTTGGHKIPYIIAPLCQDDGTILNSNQVLRLGFDFDSQSLLIRGAK